MSNWNPSDVQYGSIDGYEHEGGIDGYVGAADIVGLARRQGITPAAAMAQVRSGQIPGLRAGQRVGQSMPDVARAQISPLPQMALAANASQTFTWQPQRPFRLERLFLQSSGNNVDFVVTNLNVGADPQFVNDGQIPGTMFLPTAVGCHLRGNTANPGVTLTITLTNLTAAPITISGGIIGTSLTA
jgi:hypothetical protein